MKISLLINMKMPTIVGIFIFISREMSLLSLVEHEKSFMSSGHGLWYLLTYFTYVSDSVSFKLQLTCYLEIQGTL